MAIFQLEIADADVDRVLNAVSANYHRPEQISNPEYIPVPALDGNGDPILDEFGQPTYTDPVDENGDPIPQLLDNPETTGDFTHRMVRQFLAEHVSAYEMNEAKRAALEALNTNVVINDPDV